MAIVTLAQIKSTWLSVDGNEHDARLTDLIAQATSRMQEITRQPLDGSQTIYSYAPHERPAIHQLERSHRLLLPFTVPVVYVSAQARRDIAEAYAPLLGIVQFDDDGITYLSITSDNFNYYQSIQFTLNIGYDGTVNPIPADLTNIASEMVANEFRMTDYAGNATRIGLESILRTEAGTSSTTRFRMMDDIWVTRLRNYTRLF